MPPTPMDAVLGGGNILFLIHGRQRGHDANGVTCEPWLDVDAESSFGYVETTLLSEDTKSGQRGARRRILVPVTADAYGLSGEPWAEHWLRARAECGLDAAKDGSLFPTPGG